ncbi:hypothetical protein BN1723_004031 [Verticillium longisporum]|uniref:Uncharacterized protein n=1 Tax=Verticillium longisporum TaxID=100787 RepID=A0A0G4MJP9_VERLO|nr:hypothetical protein BN1723_004031 [Verticillium longisporum]
MASDTCMSSAHVAIERGPIADISDYRPTVVADPRPIFHRYIHNDEAMLAGYLGFGHSLCNLRTIAVSGPVLKYVPAAFALLGVPEPGCEPGDKTREEVACIWALAFLFNEKTRSVLPDTLQKIQDKYKISWSAVRSQKAQKEQLGDPKRRGQILAAVLLAMHRDILAAQQMPPEQFESTFVPAVVALEDNNPWDAPVYMLPMMPGDKITWPDWGPIKGHCGCKDVCEPLEEHDVEVYHRCLSLIRYTIYQLEPTYFYKHLGKYMKNQLDGQVALVAKIQDKYNISWSAVRSQKAQKEQLGDPKRRGQILAAVLLAMHRDILAAQQMPPEQFESTFVPAVVALEDNNPWDAPVYMLPMMPGDKITWPDWGPIKGHCGCKDVCEPLEEHDVEVYHRCLSLIRYTIYQLEPTYFYKHLGKYMKNQLDGQVALVAVARVKREQIEEVAEARAKLVEQQCKGKPNAKVAGPAQACPCSHIDELAHWLSSGMRGKVPTDILLEFQSNVKKVYEMAIEQYPEGDWTEQEKRLMSESFTWMVSHGGGGLSGPPHWTDEERKMYANLHQPFAFPQGANVKFEVNQANEYLGALVDYMSKVKLADEQVMKAMSEKQKAAQRTQEATAKSNKAHHHQHTEKSRLQQHQELLARMEDVD